MSGLDALYYVEAKAVVRRKDGLLLMLPPNPTRDGHGDWELLGGRIKEGESAADALKREAHEEAGLDDLQVARILGFFTTKIRKPIPGTEREATVILWVLECRTASEPALPDGMTARWCSPAEAAKLLDRDRFLPHEIAELVAALQ